MKHILIILSLGIIGAGLYWFASTQGSASLSLSDSSPADQTETEPNETKKTTQPDGSNQDGPSPEVATDDTPSQPQDTATEESRAAPETTEKSTQLERYEGVYRVLEGSPAASAKTAESSTPEVGRKEPNRTLQSYEATLRTINE